MENFLQVLAAADLRVLVEAGPVAVAAVAFVVVLVVAVAAAVVVVDLQEGLFRSCMDLLTPASCPSLRTARHRGSSPSWTWVRPGKTDPFPA